MLKTRVIPTMLCKGRELVKGERFINNRRVGVAMQACRIHNTRNVDELVLLEIGGGLIAPDTVSALASECFMPLAVGGGIRTMDDIHWLIGAGADKVVLAGVAYFRPELITEASRKFGAQAIVVAVNAEAQGINAWNHRLHVDPVAWAKEVQSLGAGEILLQNIGRDGLMNGYDLELIARVSEAVTIPVIASSGAGSYVHMAQALDAGAHAVAAGAMFQFTDQTPMGAAQYLHQHGYHTRIAA